MRCIRQAPPAEPRPDEKLERAQRITRESPYDLEGWSYLLHQASGWQVDAARDVYERLVSVFSTSGRFWKQYIEQEVTLAPAARAPRRRRPAQTRERPVEISLALDISPDVAGC